MFLGALAFAAVIIALLARQRANGLQNELNELWREVVRLQSEVRALRERAGPLHAAAPATPVVHEEETPAAETAPLIETPRPVEAPAVEPPPFVPPPQPHAPAAAREGNAGAPRIDWENLVGIRLFSWIAGIALVLAAVFLFKYSVDHGWLRPAVRATLGLGSGIALLIVCELRVARNYRFTANAMLGAGIAILYATLFALHARWELWPAAAAFAGMIAVTAAAVYLSTRRESVFIALLGLIGGFSTPALLSSGENRPIELFAYLLLLNGGISWIAWRKRWPLLTALSVGLTVLYQWGWVSEHLTSGQLPLAAVIFAIFAVASALMFWARDDRSERGAFRQIAAAGAVLPLLFAFFTAIVPEYGARFHVLFGFLLLVASGLAAIALLRGPRWLHAAGAAAVTLTYFIWLAASYTPSSWPWSLVWLAAFIALYLAVDLKMPTIAVYAAPLLFFAFTGLAVREEYRVMTLSGAMLALLAVVVVFALRRARPMVGAIAIALSSIAMMTLDGASATHDTVAQAALLAALMLVAWASGRHALLLPAAGFMTAIVIVAEQHTPAEQITVTAVLYALFIAYPLVLAARVRQSIAPYVAATLASGVFFVTAYVLSDNLGFADYIGAIPVAQTLVMLALLWRLLPFEREGARIALVAGTALAFLTLAIPVQLEKAWITIAWALEAAALAWLYTRVAHRGLLVWSGGLAAAVLLRLVFNSAVFEYHAATSSPVLNWYLYAYGLCAAAMFVLAWLARRESTLLQKFAATAGTLELFVLVNIQIADAYATGQTLTFNFFSSSLAQELTYTIAWALFAVLLLVAGIALQSRTARGAALALLLVTILKCFLHDLARLGGLYRVASLFGLAVSLVLVGLMLQKFVILRRAGAGVADAATPSGDASA